MTQIFILDENVAIFAQLGQNEREEPDETCLRLFEQIVQICHTLVFDPALWSSYFSQLSERHAHPKAGARVLRLLKVATQMAGKVDVRPSNASSFPEESAIPVGSQDDVQLVRLAIETGATLVTTDRPLRHDLESCGVLQTYDLTLVSPSDALAMFRLLR